MAILLTGLLLVTAGSSSVLAQDGSIPKIEAMFAAYRSSVHAHHADQPPIAPQTALDCELAGPEPDPMDAYQWARLKLNYQRDCYKQAEIQIHRRLRQLAADATTSNSRLRNFRIIKLLARTVTDPPAPSGGVVAAEDAGPSPGLVAPSVTGNVAEPSFFDELASKSSNDAKFYFERGIASYRDGDLPVAIVDFDLAIAFDPNLTDAYIDQGIAWYRMGNLHRAFDVIARVVRIESSHRACDPTAPEGIALAIKH